MSETNTESIKNTDTGNVPTESTGNMPTESVGNAAPLPEPLIDTDDRIKGMIFGSILGYTYGATHIPKVFDLAEDVPEFNTDIDWRTGVDPMFAVINALLSTDFKVDLPTIAKNLHTSYTGVVNQHPSLSGLTRETFADNEYLESPSKVALRHWIDLGRQFATNDIFCPLTATVLLEKRFESMMVISTIIQPDVRGMVAAGCYVDILHNLIWTDLPTDNIMKIASNSIKILDSDEARTHVMQLLTKAYNDQISTLNLSQPYTKFVYRGLAVTVYILQVIKIAKSRNVIPSFKKVMANIAHEQGDTTINCQIAGAVIGAFVGYKKLPKDWIQQLKNIELAEQLVACL